MNKIFRYLLCGLVLLELLPLNAQERMISMQGSYQSWQMDQWSVYQVAAPIEVYLPFNRAFSMYMMGGAASINGSDIFRMTDITDIQVGLNYHLTENNLLFSLGLNLPTGKHNLSSAEIVAVSQTSAAYTNFFLPNIGQGFNVSPGITWVQPFSDQVVFGLGLGYQYKGGYQFYDESTEDIVPGDEVMVTGGLDIKTGPLSSLSFDVVFSNYAADKYGTQEIYKSGNKIVLSSQFKQYFGFNHLWMQLRFRSKTKGMVMEDPNDPNTNLIEESVRTYPDQIEWMGLYRIHHPKGHYYGIWAEFRDYMDPVKFMLFGIGFVPEFKLSDNVMMPMRIKIKTGSFDGGDTVTGFELGAGIKAKF